MPLKIFLSSTLRKYVPGYDPTKGVNFVMDGKRTVTDICKQMNIPADKIKIIMVNGKSKSPDHILKGDDRVGLFPPVGGG
ncbi:MAG: MoaD/ThiS family protein [Deltaproteobacteria bacterium]|nr:MoaD/ThiS family protein [Deltaproteobacteria bacterium]MBW2118325.1 MoaD/ThiS family protein [Deltaproteobacteria bacterium]MBW2345075.1 MoaD/ThiS family protein [Deltaproteobacteria bacterium]